MFLRAIQISHWHWRRHTADVTAGDANSAAIHNWQKLWLLEHCKRQQKISNGKMQASPDRCSTMVNYAVTDLQTGSEKQSRQWSNIQHCCLCEKMDRLTCVNVIHVQEREKTLWNSLYLVATPSKILFLSIPFTTEFTINANASSFHQAAPVHQTLLNAHRPVHHPISTKHGLMHVAHQTSVSLCPLPGFTESRQHSTRYSSDNKQVLVLLIASQAHDQYDMIRLSQTRYQTPSTPLQNSASTQWSCLFTMPHFQGC